MQTFLPYPNFTESARVLDRQRLGKQRVEALQLLNAISANTTSSWCNHPAAKMWFGYPWALVEYGEAICIEWISRGYKDSVLNKLHDMRLHFCFVHYDKPGDALMSSVFEYPPWLGDEAFHASHRSNLLRKLPEHYRQFWPDEPDDLPYIWPKSA